MQGHFEIVLAVAIAVIPSYWTAQDNVFQLEEREPFDLYCILYTCLLALSLLVVYSILLYFSCRRSVSIIKFQKEAILDERKDFLFSILRVDKRMIPEKEMLVNAKSEARDPLRDRILKGFAKRHIKLPEI